MKDQIKQVFGLAVVLSCSGVSANTLQAVQNKANHSSNNISNNVLSQAQEIVLLDTTIENYQDLISDIQASSHHRNIHIIKVNTKDKPLEKMASILKEYQNIDAIHLFSHGVSGGLKFGNKIISENTMRQNAKQFSAWGGSLKEDGKILLYGCNVSKGDNGKQFIKTLATLTGADVHASNNTTGIPKINQDWVLEDSTGGKTYASLIKNSVNNKFTTSLEIFDNSAFLFAENVVAGIAPDGVFGSRVGAPPSDGGITNRFEEDIIGYSSSPLRNNFDESGGYDGDFFMPGTPEEGWAIRVNGTDYNNNRAFQTRVDIPGSLLNFKKNDRFSSVDWLGGIDGLDIKQTYRTYNLGLAIIIDVTLKNNTALKMDNVYYMRTVDPDNNNDNKNVAHKTSSSVTTNEIVSQGESGVGATVSASQQRAGRQGNSLVTLTGYADNARVSYNTKSMDDGGQTRSPVDVYNGTGSQTNIGKQEIDSPISLAFKFDEILPGEEVRFTWSYGLADIAFPKIKLDVEGPFKQVYLLGTEGLPIAGNNISIEGSGVDQLTSMKIKISNPMPGDQLRMPDSLPAGISIDIEENNDDFEISVEGVASKENYIRFLQSIRFDNQDLTASLATRDVIVMVFDQEYNPSNGIESQVFVTVPLEIDKPIAGDDFLNKEEATLNLPIKGTAAPASDLTLTLTDSKANTVIETVSPSSDGRWEIDISPENIARLADGVIAVDASTKDQFDHITEGDAEFTKDTKIVLIISNPDTETTITANEFVVDGEADPDSEVVVTLPSGKEYITTADPQGKWSITVDSFKEDFNKVFEVKIKATDPANNTVESTLNLKTPPHPVDFTDLDEDANGVTQSTSPVISGTSLADTKITVIVSTPKGDELCSTTTSDSGRWSCKLPILESGGPYPIKVESEASSGNIAIANEEITVADLEVEITEPVFNALISPNNPLVFGVSDPGAIVVVTTRGDKTCTVTADSSGRWSCNLPNLDKGEEYVFTATATDEADNEATDTTNVTTSNLPLTVLSPAFGALLDNDSPIITGKTDPGVEITVTTAFEKVCKTQADAKGDWACPLERMPVGGPHELRIDAVDNTRKINSSIPWRVSIADVPLSVTSPTFNGLAQDNTPIIIGNSDPEAEITVTTEFGKVCKTTADAKGDWACPLESMPIGGPYDLTIAAKNLDRDVETTIPWKLAIPNVPLEIVEPEEGGTVANNPVVVKGISNPNATITVKGINGQECTTISDDTGAWSCELFGLNMGEDQPITITETKDGKTQEAVRNINVVIPLLVTEPEENGKVVTPSALVTGTTDPNSGVNVKGPDGEECTTTSNAIGEWSCRLEGLKSGNDKKITVTSTNQNGVEKAIERLINIDIDDGEVETILKGGGGFTPTILFLMLLFLLQKLTNRVRSPSIHKKQ